MSHTISVMHPVLNIPELLEAMLLQAEPRTLLQCRQVNTTFELTINQSPAIQHDLSRTLVLNHRSISMKDSCCNTRVSPRDLGAVGCQLEQVLQPLGRDWRIATRQSSWMSGV